MHIRDLLVETISPEDLPESLSAFISRNTEKTVNVVDILGDFFGEQTTLQETESRITNELDSTIVISELTDGRLDYEYIMRSDLITALTQFDSSDGISTDDPLIPTYNGYSDGQVRTIALSELTSMLGDAVDQTDVIINGLNNLSSYLIDRTQDFYSRVVEVTVNSVQAGSNAAKKFAMNMSTLLTKVGDVSAISASDLVKSTLANLGFNVGQGTTVNEISTYGNVSVISAMMNEIGAKVNWDFSTIESTLMNIRNAIIRAIGYVVGEAVNYLVGRAEDAFMTTFDANTALVNATIPGRGTISGPAFGVIPNADSVDPYLDQLTQAISNFAGTFTSSTTYCEYTLPMGPVILYLSGNKKSPTVTYVIQIMNYTAVSVLWNNLFGTTLHLNVINDKGVLKPDPNGYTQLANSGIEQEDFLSFLTVIENNPDTYYCRSGKTDASAYMDVLTARFVMGIYLGLINTTDEDYIDYTTAYAIDTGWLAVDITLEDGYNSSLGLEPSNLHMARICSCMGLESGKIIAFDGGSINVPVNDQNIIDCTTSFDSRYWQGSLFFAAIVKAFTAICRVNDVMNSGFFVPYYSKLKTYRPSFKVPTDTDNIAKAKRLLVIGLTVIAVVVTVVVVTKVMKSLSRKRFELDAKAGQLSWNAAEHGNTKNMQKAYKLARRASLLSNLTGVASQASSGVIGSVMASAAAAVKNVRDTSTSTDGNVTDYGSRILTRIG